ncbi:DUF5709 domain-containing protein [Streptomyces prunicolor]|uniref:DUF5709 domain-containing protein n=1 Tax=Streptomyces prunicolor TaxID=67348 RepID=UPI00037B12AE
MDEAYQPEGLDCRENEGARDTEKGLLAHDGGIDGGAAFALEAAVHRIPDEDDDLP